MSATTFGPTQLFHMKDVKQADKVSKAWAKEQWLTQHNKNQHNELSPNPNCPFCQEWLK